MSSADLLQCMPANGGEVVNETLPAGTSSTGLPSSPSVSVSSSESPSQTSPSSACGSSGSDRRVQPEAEENVTVVDEKPVEAETKQEVTAAESQESVATSTATSTSASPVKLDSSSGQQPGHPNPVHAPNAYLQNHQPPQRLNANAARPRRLRISRNGTSAPFANRVAVVNPSGPNPARTVNGEMAMFNPAVDFSPSSNSSSPLTGYGAQMTMNPYPMVSNLVYPTPQMMVGDQAEENGEQGGAQVSSNDAENVPESGDATLMATPTHVVQVHVSPGVIFNVRVGEDVHQFTGPATVPMVSPNGPPHPLPLQVPPGHVVQQVIDEHGTLRHVILSLQGPPPPGVFTPSSVEGGEFMGPITSTSSPSQGVVNGGAVGSSGSGGSRTNTPPSPPQQAATFQPSTQTLPPPPPFTLYHPIHPPPPFLIPPHPMSLPAGPPIPGQPYPAVSPVGMPMPNMDGGVYHPATSSSGTSSRPYYPRGNIANSQSKEDGSHDSSTEEASQQQVYPEMTSPVIFVSNDGAPILVQNSVPNYEIPSLPNGGYQPMEPFPQSQPRKNYPGVPPMTGGGASKKWRKMPTLPARLRPRPDMEHHTDGGGDDTSSSGSGRAPSSPRARGNSIDSSSIHGGKKFQPNKTKERSFPHHQPRESGHSTPGDNVKKTDSLANGEPPSGEQAVAPVEETEEEIERRRIIEAVEAALSQLGPPKLINVTATSLTVEMAPLPTDSVVKATGLTEASAVASARQHIVYDVSLSVPLRENQMDNIYTGQAAEVNVVDLKPATPYSLGVSAVYSGPPIASPTQPVRGSQLPLLIFQTKPSVPEKPDPPKLARRNAVKSSALELRWTPPTENGSDLVSYILEWKQGPSLNEAQSVGQTSFSEIFRCAAEERHYRLTNLQPATLYSFRLAATNGLGQSAFSDEVTYRTSGAPPPAPEPPQLRQADATSLTLYWLANVGGAVSSSPLVFTLQMDDLISGHGFLPVYNGADVTEFEVTHLRRNSEYRFRLAAQNDDGTSPYSEPVVTFKTLPGLPKPPHRVSVKSAGNKAMPTLSSHSIRLVWDAPRDDGGSPIESYEVQVTEPKSDQDVQPIYMSTAGPDREILVENLKPGRAYNCRIRAKGMGGIGQWSDVAYAATAPVCPDACSLAPTIKGRAKSTSVELEWAAPGMDGGVAVASYEVRVAEVTNSQLSSPAVLTPGDVGEFRKVYSGPDLSCIIDKLAPGVSYVFQVRAGNKVGAGPWNPSLPTTSPVDFVTTAASRPDAPGAPDVLPISAHVIGISWRQPKSNGAKVTEYRLEESCESSSSTFLLVYSGPQLSYEAKSLEPATQYSFRLQAVNAAGASPYSPVVSCQTPPAPPAAPTEISAESISPHSFALKFSPPIDNGSAVVSYNILINPGERCIALPIVPPSPLPKELEDEEEQAEEEGFVADDAGAAEDVDSSALGVDYLVEDLVPDTVYRVRVQAVNRLGAGAFSAPAKVITPPLPPQPPELELAESSHNMMRIRWTAVPPAATALPGSDLTEYTILMDKPNMPRLQPVWTGSSLSFTAKRLHERTQYRFAIQAKTQSGGTGPQSPAPRAFTTLPAPPPVPTNLTVLCKDGEAVVTASWRPVASSIPVDYILQWTTPSTASFVQLYRGPETSFSIAADQLVSGIHSMRVSAVLVLNGEEWVSAKSQMSAFSQSHSFRIHKTSPDHVQLLSPTAEVTPKTEKTVVSSGGKSGIGATEPTAASSNSAAAFRIIRMLEALNLRRRSEDESWTDTQLAAGFVMAFTVLALVLSYVAHSFLSTPGS